MERLLQMEEILRQIFGNLLPDFDMKRSFIDSTDTEFLPIPDKLTRTTLHNAALTCRSFMEPALDTLWWAMDDIRPLFSLLPNFQLDDELDESTYTISGPIFEQECLKFDAYARRVKFFHLRWIRGVSIVDSAFVQVSHALGRNHILPSLRYLHCDFETPLLLFLLSPYLRAFCAIGGRFHYDSKPLEVHTFLNILCQASSSLVCLRLHIGLERQNLESICRMSQLKYLSLRNAQAPDISLIPDFLQTFSASMSLTCLHLLDAIDFPMSWNSSSPACCFPTLTSIKIDTRMTLAQITRLFCVTKFPRLEELMIPFMFVSSDPSKSDDFPNFARYLVQSTGFALRCLDFGDRNYNSASKHGTSISSLTELRSLPLTKFRLRYLNSISMADIKMIVGWWPNLQVLKIRSFLPKKPGFDALIMLANGLPRLIRLNIDLDFSNVPSLEDVPLLTHPLRRLQLTVPTSYLTNPVHIAHCIDMLFPNIREITIERLDRGQNDSWGGCKVFLAALQRARKQESLRRYGTPDSDVDSDIDF